MREIYGKTHDVIVWLGEAGGGSELVMGAKNVDKLNGKLKSVPNYGVQEEVTVYGLPNLGEPIWQAVGTELSVLCRCNGRETRRRPNRLEVSE